ncbi:MAG: class II aldolase, partial [Pseudomonadota bacterium]|nr:class II aldolase [Pseudomonadota bacterium]
MGATAVQGISRSSSKRRISKEEWQVRIDLAAAYRLAHLYGWTTTLIYNHISARLPGPDHHFLLNP